MKPFRGPLAVLLAAGLATGCQGLPEDEAVKLVREFDARLADAYRTGDATRVEGIAGDEQMKRITGLIGAKLDQRITLDAQLVEFKVLEVKGGHDRVTVVATERWIYRDRRIGTGVQVGEGSADTYAMRYVLVRHGGRWLVDGAEFAEPPQVGRTRALNSASASRLHSVETQPTSTPKGTP